MPILCGVFGSCFGGSGDEEETELQPTSGRSGRTAAEQSEETAHQAPPPPPRLDTSQPHPRVWRIAAVRELRLPE